jgi:hypothetical protein
MNTNVLAQPAPDGFKALSDADKRWFLIRVQELSRAPTKESQVSPRLWIT